MNGNGGDGIFSAPAHACPRWTLKKQSRGVGEGAEARQDDALRALCAQRPLSLPPPLPKLAGSRMPAPGKLPGGSLRTPPGPHLHGAGKRWGRVVSVGFPEGFDSSWRRRRGLRPPIDASPAAAPALLLLFLCPLLLLLLLLRGEGHSPLLLALPALARHRQGPSQTAAAAAAPAPARPRPAACAAGKEAGGGGGKHKPFRAGDRAPEEDKPLTTKPQSPRRPLGRRRDAQPGSGSREVPERRPRDRAPPVALPSSSFSSSSSACHHPSLGQHRH